jgi:fatty-acyl-CoA synthase
MPASLKPLAAGSAEPAAEPTNVEVPGGSLAPRGGLSYVGGDRNDPLRHITIADQMAQTVAKFGHRDAAVFPAQGCRVTYDELSGAIDRLACGLLALGLEPGDRIGIWSPNRYEWLLTQFAAARTGLILVTINPAYRLYELDYALNKVGCKALVTAASFKSSDYLKMLAELAPELANAEPGQLKLARLPTLRVVIRMSETKTPGMLNFDQVMALGGSAEQSRLDGIAASLRPDDPINVQFTSGTTGSPKGATLTHFNILNNAHFVTRAIRLTEEDRLCIPVPLYHCFGMVMGTLGCITKGACMVFPGEAFDADATLAAISAERCTALYGVPTMFVALLESPRFASTDLSSLRTGIMAGSPCPIEVMKKVVAAMNMREVTIAYGMTETSPVSFQSAADDPIERRVSTVGRVHPHVEVKIVDEAGATVPIGEKGELWTRGYSVMKGYWDDPVLTAESIVDDGWMRTGDLATIDAEGYGNIVGRVKDMIIRGGENIYPREIEEFLYRHPKIQQVQVFGIPSQRYGEEVCAWIVLMPGETATEDEIRAFCDNQIAHYKVPKLIRFVAGLPMTVTGKPQKFIMRDTMIDELGLVTAKTA